MNIGLRKPRMTRDQFFDWAERQGIRYEFDGLQPVAVTGGTVNHSQITQNIHFALRTRLRGGPCRPLGPDAGVATVSDAVRYPDAVVTCTKTPGTSRLVDNPIIVFEALSPTSGRTDRILKLREYRAVATIRRYVILEHASVGLTVFARSTANEDWRATALTAEDTLKIPEIGIEIPVAEFYEDVDLPDPAAEEARPESDVATRT